MNLLSIGTLALKAGTVQVSEPRKQAEQGSARPHVQLKFEDDELDMSLDELRALKALLTSAEKRLVARQEQALKAKNLTLDL